MTRNDVGVHNGRCDSHCLVHNGQELAGGVLPFSDSGTPKNRRFVRLEYCSSWSRSASHVDSLASRAAIYWSFFSNRSLSCDVFSLNVSSLLVRACGLSTWRNFWTTASFDNSSTNLTSRASSFGPISAVSEALSPLRLGGMIGSNYFKKIRHKLVNSLPRSKRCHTSAAILNENSGSGTVFTVSILHPVVS